LKVFIVNCCPIPATNNNCPVKGSETDAEDSSEKGNIEKEWTGGIELKSNVCPRPILPKSVMVLGSHRLK
jgi:hypothetical protein